MSFGAVALLAVGLAMDATAVSAARGMAVSVVRPRYVVTVAAFFGAFQAFMPLVGWFLGARIGPSVQAWDHWIAFFLLAGIGGKMLWEARGTGDAAPQASRTDDELFGLRVMSMLALATSIDALAAGITLPMFDAPLPVSLVTIGATTAVLSAAGLFAGRKFGAVLGKRLDIFGGLVLVALGTKILLEHLSAAHGGG